MFNKASLRNLTVGALSVGFFVLATGAPAQAAPPTLPVGDSLYAIACPYYTDTTVSVTNNQLLIVDPSDATAVNRGTGDGGGNATSNSNCAAGAAWDATTDTAYFVYWTDGYDYPVLATIDLATGATSQIGEFTEAGVANDYITAIAIGSDGSAYAIDYDGYSLFSLDLATGALTEIYDDVDFNEDPYGFAFNPADGEFYAVDYDGEFYRIDVTDGSVVSLGTPSGFVLDEIYGLAIDGNGVAWFANDEDYLSEYAAPLWSVDLADFATDAEPSGRIEVSGGVVYTESFFIAPFVAAPAAAEPAAPALAETGVDGALAASLTGFALVSVLLGTAFLVLRRRAKLS